MALTIDELKEDVFEVRGLQVDWNDEATALAQIEAEAQNVTADLVETGLMTVDEAKALVKELIISYQ